MKKKLWRFLLSFMMVGLSLNFVYADIQTANAVITKKEKSKEGLIFSEEELSNEILELLVVKKKSFFVKDLSDRAAVLEKIEKTLGAYKQTYEVQKKEGMVKKLFDVASEVSVGAGIGAGVGSLVPILGTITGAISGALGAVIDGVTTYYSTDWRILIDPQDDQWLGVKYK